MNKRFIMAIALSAAILFFWQLFFAPAHQTIFNNVQKNSVTLKKKNIPVHIGQIGNIATASPSHKVIGSRSMKIFQNSLMKIGLLDNGTIGRLKLLKYKNDNSAPTELIAKTDNFNPLQLVFVDSKLNAEAKNVKYTMTVDGNANFTNNKTTVTYTGNFKNFILKKYLPFILENIFTISISFLKTKLEISLSKLLFGAFHSALI